MKPFGKRKKSKYDENAWWERDEVEIDGQWCGGGDKRLPSYGKTVSIDFPTTAYGGGFLGLVNCLELVICRRWCVMEELEAEVSWFPFGLQRFWRAWRVYKVEKDEYGREDSSSFFPI